MPKGLKTFYPGDEHHWFVCRCGYRYTGSTQTAKSMAFRLHQKRCEVARGNQLTHHLGPDCAPLETATKAVDDQVKTMKLMNREFARV